MKIENGENLEGVGGMIWNTVTLDELIEIKHGYPFKSKSFSDSGQYILLTPGNCYESGGLKLKGSKEKYYTGDIPKDYLLSRGDLLVVMTDLVNTAPILGGAFMIPEDDKFLHNQRLGLINIIDDSRIHKKFLYYVLNIKSYRGQVRGSASGATVRHTSPDRIKRCRMCIPDTIAVQGRIASILSTYDDLIENNRRRIQLLEQAARLLYKEWFVHLRFPGHQQATITNGVPEGWERKAVGDVAEVVKGKNITKDLTRDGSVPVVAGGLSPAYYHDISNVTGPVITISASGANAGYVSLYQENIWASDCSYISGVSVKFFYYLYLLIKSKQREIYGFQKGAAQPHVYPKDIQRLLFYLPEDSITKSFEEFVSHNFHQVKNFLEQNKVLTQARDILLPRLMSGRTIACQI